MPLSAASSFRDPFSCIEIRGDVVCRVITDAYRPIYDKLMQSGLYKELEKNGLIIPHFEADGAIYPEVVKPITYPYEWSFSQYKNAALATLKITRMALDYGLILKDASAFNIQRHHNNWLLIDTGSFMIYQDGDNWPAYGQFIRHFLCPLMACAYGDTSALKSLMLHIDGKPVTEWSKRLPVRTWTNINALLHVHSHRLATGNTRSSKISKMRLVALLESLMRFIYSLEYAPKGGWVGYAPEEEYTRNKKLIMENWLKSIKGVTLLDIGANRGEYSQLAYKLGYEVTAIDREHDCIDRMDGYFNKLVVDFTNPTPAVGWGNTERQAFFDRVTPDIVIGLALLHHVCVGNNVPLAKVAEFMAQITSEYLILEWVDGSDPNAERIGAGRCYPQYNLELYLKAFAAHFRLVRKVSLTHCRSLCMWQKKPAS